MLKLVVFKMNKNSLCYILGIKFGGMFESMVVITFQSIFHLEIYQNNIYL